MSRRDESGRPAGPDVEGSPGAPGAPGAPGSPGSPGEAHGPAASPQVSPGGDLVDARDPVQAARLAQSWRDLAGRLGIPEIIESGAGVLPGSTTSHVVYDLGVAVSLALGDLAEAVDSYVDGPAAVPLALPVVGSVPVPGSTEPAASMGGPAITGGPTITGEPAIAASAAADSTPAEEDAPR